MATPAKKTFFAEATKGFIIKVIIDTLCGGGINRGIFVIKKSGITLRQSDQASTVLYDVELPCNQLKNYHCQKSMIISLNLKHLQGLLKTIKKKDCVTMYIDPKDAGKFFITIRPEGAREGTRFETKSIAYQEEKDYQPIVLPEGKYKYPMVISASDFQKIKQLTSIGKVITITIQKSNYLSFKCDAGVVMDSELGFGQLDDPMDVTTNTGGVCKMCSNSVDDCWCQCEECDEYLSECWCECDEGCGQYKSECSCDTEEPFRSEYYSLILNKLVKLPGLCAQMQFYAPRVPQFPLMIEAIAGQGGYTLGKIRVYIKDVQQITYEASLQNENDIPIQVTKSKGKGKKKN